MLRPPRILIWLRLLFTTTIVSGLGAQVFSAAPSGPNGSTVELAPIRSGAVRLSHGSGLPVLAAERKFVLAPSSRVTKPTDLTRSRADG